MNHRRRKIDVTGDGGDIDGLAGFSPPASRLWAHHRPDLLPPAGSPVVAADLCLAAIRRLAGVSGAAEIPRVLAREPGRAAALRDGGALPAAAAGGDPGRRRRIQFTLILRSRMKRRESAAQS